MIENNEASPHWHQIAGEADHRPWPVPDGPWIMAQTWRDLLFAHWPVEPATLRPLLPTGLTLDTFDGDGWLGVVPFDLSYLALRNAPQQAALAFLELNVRTYVSAAGIPGVWFFSLDAASPLAVAVARATFHLPYFRARMRLSREGERIDYGSRRTHSGAPAAEFEGSYEPTGLVYRSEPGNLDHWLTERYCLYSADRAGRLYRGEINHPPWPLQPAVAEIAVNTMTTPIGIALHGEPVLHIAHRLDVVAWRPVRMGMVHPLG
jgi:uncharacterized protein